MEPTRLRDENFYTVLGWMLNVLGLKGNELIVFAIIYSFSQDGISEFSGSLPFLEGFSNLSRMTVVRSLDALVKKSYILKRTYRDGNNQLRTAYRVNFGKIDALKTGLSTMKGNNSG